MEKPYSFRFGKVRIGEEKKSLKAEMERLAVEKDMPLPELMRRLLKSYIRKSKAA